MRNQAPGGIPSFGIKTVGRINFKNRQIIIIPINAPEAHKKSPAVRSSFENRMPGF